MTGPAPSPKRPRRRIVTNPEEDKQLRKERRGRMTKEEQCIMKSRLLRALRNNMGLITYACREVGIPCKTHLYWLRTDTVYARKFYEVIEMQKDFVERKFLEKIQAGDGQAIWRYLSTKARDRGYIPIHRQETSGPDGKPIEVNETLSIEDMKTHMPQDDIDDILLEAQNRKHRRENRNERKV